MALFESQSRVNRMADTKSGKDPESLYAIDGAMVKIGRAQFLITIEFPALQDAIAEILRDEERAFNALCEETGGDAMQNPALFKRMQRVRALIWAKELAERKTPAGRPKIPSAKQTQSKQVPTF
jgi:hypothetical protein